MTDAIQTFGPEAVEQLYQGLGVQPHPYLKLPGAAEVARLLSEAGGRERLLEFLQRRQQRLRMANEDPLQWGFEADTWRDADALLQGTWRAKEEEEEKEDEDERRDCYILAIFGGNRAMKTWYAVKRAVQVADLVPRTRLLIGAEKELSSITTVQADRGGVWYYLRAKYGHLNGNKRHPIVKINWSQSGGFTDRKLVLPNGSEIYFPTYNENPGDYEGWEFGAPAYEYLRVKLELERQGRFCPPNIGAVMDESMPLNWLLMLSRRVKFRKAKLLWPFTPVKGITPAIKELVGSSAQTLESRPSELLPRQNLPDVPAGQMPYIRKCVFPGAMAIYFFSEVNRFSTSPGRTYYDEVKELCAGKTTEYVERVAYGLARDSVARAFPTFGPWNIVRREQLPAVGTNYKFTDPAGARNWATWWVRVTPGDPPSLYIYRDWPDAQTYGEWAVPTERQVSDENRKGWDGDPGPAQHGLGLGVTKLKLLFLELERVKGGTERDPYRKRLWERAQTKGWDPAEVREEIAERYVDPRAGKSEHLAEQGGTCIIDEFAEEQVDGDGQVIAPGMELIPASGVNIDEGLTAVNELLSWNQDEPLCPVTNQPHLFVCEDCQQARWMFENYTGLAGEKGACKDFADLARYMALAKLTHVDAVAARGRAGRGF